MGHEWLGSKRHGRGGRRVVELEKTWWTWDTSDHARTDVVGVGLGRSGSRGPGGGGTRAIALKLTRWRWEMSGWAQRDVVEAGDERSRSN